MAMNVKEIRFFVLDVGQGACNYVEIVNSANVVTHNMLIDLGTSGAFAVAEANVQWLINRIKGRADPRIDVVLLTHGDLDHYNLIGQLLTGALMPAATTRIGLVRYGGVAWRYRANKSVEKGQSLIKALKTFCADVQGLTDALSGYDAKTKTFTYLWPAAPDANDPKLAILVANTPHHADKTIKQGASRANGVAINTKSLVYGIGWAGKMYVGTGDATAYTFNAANEHLKGVTFPPVVMMTMPHHGSKVTTYDLAAAEDDPVDGAVKAVDKFLEIFKPYGITISANESGHFHPSMYTLNQFAKVLDMEVMWMDPTLDNDNHYLTAYVDLNIEWPGAMAWPAVHTYATVQTDVNLYSTMYYVGDWIENYLCPPLPADQPDVNDDAPMLPPPARGKNWLFTLNKEGAVTLTPWDNAHPATTINAAFNGAPTAAPPTRTAAIRPLATAAPAPVAASRAVLLRQRDLYRSWVSTAPRPGDPGPSSPAFARRLRPIA